MRAYELKSGDGIDGLTRVDRTSVALGPHDVRIGIGATALNRRDLMFADGQYGIAPDRAIIPLCDGAGQVIETGAAVTRFKQGDHVIASFWPLWSDGEIGPEKTNASFGAQIDGTLAEELVANEQALALAPRGLSSVEAAAIPCAGLTAWNALFVGGGLKPGATVLLLGTSRVSVWALQLARAAGLSPIVTSSSEDKLARARELGAVETINYRTTPEWQDEVKRLTGGRGVDLVVEVGGKGTMPRSISAARMGGTVVVVGSLSGFDDGGVGPGALIGGAKTLAGIMVGSRTMLEDLVRFIDVTGIRPVIDRRFAFDDALAAYRYMKSGEHFGKVVVEVG